MWNVMKLPQSAGPIRQISCFLGHNFSQWSHIKCLANITHTAAMLIQCKNSLLYMYIQSPPEVKFRWSWDWQHESRWCKSRLIFLKCKVKMGEWFQSILNKKKDTFILLNNLHKIWNDKQMNLRRKYRISRTIRCTFFTEKCDLKSTCILYAECKYLFPNLWVSLHLLYDIFIVR